MISSDLKALELSPRASLPFSWNSDGDSGVATGGQNGVTEFQQHLKSAQSAQSSETSSSSVAVDPTRAETAPSPDLSSRVSPQIPSTHPPARPSSKPVRKASFNLRAMVDAKVRFIGPSTAPISTAFGTSLLPSSQSGMSSLAEPLGHAEGFESELRRPSALNSGSSPRNEGFQGLPERPLMDSRRLPDAEVVLVRNGRADPQAVPSSKQISADVFSTPSDAGQTYASRMVLKRPNYASSPESNFEMQTDFASGLEELPASVSTNPGGGESTSPPQTIAAIGARVGAVQIPANGPLQVVGKTETFQSFPTSQSATVSDPSMGSDSIASGIRETARRAVAQSQILGTPPASVASVRPANNNNAFRSLILEPGTGTLPSFATDLAPLSGELSSDNALRSDSVTPPAFSQASFPPSWTSEPNGAELSVSNSGGKSGLITATGSNLQPIIPIESGSQNGGGIQREARSLNPSSEFIKNAPANPPLETVPNGVPNLIRVQRNLAAVTPTPPISKEVSGTARGLSELETGLSENQGLANTIGGKSGLLTATGSNLQPIIPIESGSQNGGGIQREALSSNPSLELIKNDSPVEAVGLTASSESSVAESQSSPKPSVQPLRPANRSPRAKGADTVASNASSRTSLEADNRFPTPLALDNGAEDRMRFDTLGRDAGSGSSSDPGHGHSQATGTPATGLFPGVPQGSSVQDPLVDGSSNSPKTSDAGTSASLLHESHKSSAVRLVHLDSPGSGGLELRIQELGDKLIVRTQDLVGSLDGQSTQWKELQQRLEASGIVLMPVDASLGATAAPIEPRNSSEELRHTICYDGNMGSTGRDSSDPRSSSGRARSLGEPSHSASPELPDESIDSAEAPPASRQWWA